VNGKFLDIVEYTAEGYKPLVDFGTWRVAFLRFIDELIPENIYRVERHNETDEVFVLLAGQAVLFMGEGDDGISKLYHFQMEPGKLYNVRQHGWHTCVLSRDATILLVENRDTAVVNTDYLELSPQQREVVVKVSSELIEDWRE